MVDLLIKNLNKKINELNQIKKEIEVDGDIEDAEYYLDETIPKFKNEIKTLHEYFVQDEIKKLNKDLQELNKIDEPDWYILYIKFRDLIIDTEAELEMFLTNNKE
jgi:hypothetical protein